MFRFIVRGARGWSLLSVVLVAVGASGCKMGNYKLRDHMREHGLSHIEPCVESLERRQLAQVGETYWYPLIALDVRLVQPTSDAGYRPGHAMKALRAWGPLFAVTTGEVGWFDETGELYEIRRGRSVLWGLFRSSETISATPTGEREEASHDLLFGLLSFGPTVEYRAERSALREAADQPVPIE
ncbi:MAG: hypothetical protein KDC38_18065 [Planctomycetes bacterium]|nr:hypothetical protein [Planctomycetota bacterium]